MIIFTGIAGSGKSVQGQLLAKQLSCKWVSIGAVLRDRVSDELKERMLHGYMLDDEQVIAYLQPLLQEASAHEFILDGFPRSVYQAEWLIAEAKRQKWPIEAIFHLTLDKQQARERLLQRGRPDDNEGAITERFQEYDETISAIITRMRSEGLNVQDIDGSGTVEEVNLRIRNALERNGK